MFLSPHTADAFNITRFYTYPEPLVAPPGQDTLYPPRVRIQYNITVDEPGTYNVYLRRGGVGPFGDISFRDLIPNSSNVLVNSLSQPPDIETSNEQIFRVGSHEIEVEQIGVGGNNIRKITYEIFPDNSSQQVTTCAQISGLTSANPDTDIKFSGVLLPAGRYRFFIPASSNREAVFTTDSSGNFPEQNLGKLASGTYQIKLQKWVRAYIPGVSYNTREQWQDSNCFLPDLVVSPTAVNPTPNTSPIPIGSGAPVAPGATPTATPCTGSNCTKAGGDPCGDASNPGFKTAIGCIHTSPIEFTKDFLKFIVAIGGGLAFLMMLLGAFQMLTSAGNPETLQTGRDRLTSAIIGLLFVIFAVLLMQIIGFDILGLPGFNR